jgi:hypothetical protein
MTRQATHQHRTAVTTPAIGTAERLAAYAFTVGCLLALLMDSPVPMAIAP